MDWYWWFLIAVALCLAVECAVILRDKFPWGKKDRWWDE